jgi:uncharacterized protein YhhL (DUF1145 family)
MNPNILQPLAHNLHMFFNVSGTIIVVALAANIYRSAVGK